MTSHDNEPYVTISLWRLPASPDAGDPEGAVAYEVICRYCGDDPVLDYQEVPAGLRRIRGPYPIEAGIATFLEHDELHGRTGTRTGRERGMRTLVPSVRGKRPRLLRPGLTGITVTPDSRAYRDFGRAPAGIGHHAGFRLLSGLLACGRSWAAGDVSNSGGR